LPLYEILFPPRPLHSIAFSRTHGAGVEILTSLANDVLLILNKIFSVPRARRCNDAVIGGGGKKLKRRSLRIRGSRINSKITNFSPLSGDSIQVAGRDPAKTRCKSVATSALPAYTRYKSGSCRRAAAARFRFSLLGGVDNWRSVTSIKGQLDADSFRGFTSDHIVAFAAGVNIYSASLVAARIGFTLTRYRRCSSNWRVLAPSPSEELFINF